MQVLDIAYILFTLRRKAARWTVAVIATSLEYTMSHFFVRWGVVVVLSIFSMVGLAQAAQQQRASAKKHVVTKATAKSKVTRRPASVRALPVAAKKPSYGHTAGLQGGRDPLSLKSSVALVVDQDTQEVLFRKNDQAVLPIASITKLMTGVLISEAKLPLDEMVTITQDDVDTEKGSTSRLSVGTELSRGELLHLALMSSENRAAHALGRTYPGGLSVFVGLMNAKAKALGMLDTNYEEPTGLSSKNQSSAKDLATLVDYAYDDALLRDLSTSPDSQVLVGKRMLQYKNTNLLVKNPAWEIGLQKTGYIREAGRCLVMQAKVAGRKLIMVFLDSTGKLTRIADAERVRRWLESSPQPRHIPLASADTLQLTP